jgi:predicted Zn-dependent protease
MGGMGGISEAISGVLSILGIELAPWMFPAFVAALAVVMSPWLMQNMKTSRARTFLKESRVLDGDARGAMEARALDTVSGSRHGLVAVVEEAHRMRRNALARKALVELRELTGTTPEVARLARLTDPEPLPNSPAQLGLMVEKLRKAGLDDKAGQRLRRGLNRWPDDPWLQALASAEDRRRMATTASPTDAATTTEPAQNGAEGPTPA